MDAVVEVRGLKKVYPGKPPVVAVDGIDLTVPFGESEFCASEVIFPLVPKPTLASGKPNCGVLKKLKNSLRNCRLRDSRNRMFLKNERSKFTSPGPYRMSRPALPNLNGAGVANAEMS